MIKRLLFLGVLAAMAGLFVYCLTLHDTLPITDICTDRVQNCWRFDALGIVSIIDYETYHAH